MMKLTGTIITLLLLTISMTSCNKVFRKVTIDRDCTGTYIELNDKDYLVCNPSMTDSFLAGSSVKVKYKSSSDCSKEQNVFQCELYHKSYGFVEITKIK